MEQDDAEKMAAQLNQQLETERFGKRFIAVDINEIDDEINMNGFIVMLEE